MLTLSKKYLHSNIWVSLIKYLSTVVKPHLPRQLIITPAKGFMERRLGGEKREDWNILRGHLAKKSTLDKWEKHPEHRMVLASTLCLGSHLVEQPHRTWYHQGSHLKITMAVSCLWGPGRLRGLALSSCLWFLCAADSWVPGRWSIIVGPRWFCIEGYGNNHLGWTWMYSLPSLIKLYGSESARQHPDFAQQREIHTHTHSRPQVSLVADFRCQL